MGLGANRTRTSLISRNQNLDCKGKKGGVIYEARSVNLQATENEVCANTSHSVVDSYFIAMQEISTLTSFGSLLTSTVSRAGGFDLKYSP